MHTPRLVHLARLIGRDAFIEALGPPERIANTEPRLRQRLSALVDRRIDAIAASLIEEAAASDDVTGADAALVYAQDELASFDDLLTEAQRTAILERFRAGVARWSA